MNRTMVLLFLPQMSVEVYRSRPIPLATVTANLFEYMQRTRTGTYPNPVLTRKLDPETPDLEQWIIENRDKLRKQFGSDT